MEEIDVDLEKPRTSLTRIRPRARNFETDIDHNSVVRSRISRKSLHHETFLNEGYFTNEDKVRREQVRLYGSGRTQQQQDLEQIKKDVQLLQTELALRQQSRIKTYKLRRKHPNRSRVYTYSIPNQQYQKQKYRGKPRSQYHSPEYYRLRTSPKKKLYKIKPKIHQYRQYVAQEPKLSMPLITMNRISMKRYRSDNDYPVIYSRKKLTKHPLNVSRLLRTSYNLKRVRKIANVILFTIRLRTFNARMRKRRIKIFKNFVQESLNTKLLQLKELLIQYSRPFFVTLIDQQNFSYRLHEKDEPKLNRQKVVSTLKLISMEVKCLQRCVRHIIQKDLFSQTFYLLCKHGNYSSVEQINTNEQMNLICISEVYGYSRSDKNLQKSAILSLVFIKILLFNILLQPERINIKISASINPTIIYSNLRLIGNILYELLINVQDQYLERAPGLYKIGNWVKLKQKFNFKISESMTLKQGFYQKNELISGLASHNYIQSVYKLSSLEEERHLLTELVRLLHQSIVRYHLQVRKQTFIM